MPLGQPCRFVDVGNNMNLSNLVRRLDMTTQLNVPTGGAHHSADSPAFVSANRTDHEEDRREDEANR